VVPSQQFGANQTDVFLVDKNGDLNVFWVVGEGPWGGPQRIGSNFNPGSYVVASQQFGANQTDVFLVDENGQLDLFWVAAEGPWGGPISRTYATSSTSSTSSTTPTTPARARRLAAGQWCDWNPERPLSILSRSWSRDARRHCSVHVRDFPERLSISSPAPTNERANSC
jgi:hypothetical protein